MKVFAAAEAANLSKGERPSISNRLLGEVEGRKDFTTNVLGKAVVQGRVRPALCPHLTPVIAICAMRFMHHIEAAAATVLVLAAFAMAAFSQQRLFGSRSAVVVLHTTSNRVVARTVRVSKKKAFHYLLPREMGTICDLPSSSLTSPFDS